MSECIGDELKVSSRDLSCLRHRQSTSPGGKRRHEMGHEADPERSA